MKKLNLPIILIIFLLSAISIFAQTQPKAGRYTCLTSVLNNAPGATLGSLIYLPATFGNIILDGKGNYQLPSLKNGGKYNYDTATATLTFTTGDLRAFKVARAGIDNGKYRFIINYQNFGYECSNQTASNDSNGTNPNTPVILNKGLKGNLLVSTSNRYGGYLGSVYSIDLATGRFSIIFPDGVGVQNVKGEILYFDKTSSLKITDKTGNLTVKQLTQNSTVGFDDMYPAFSDSGEYYALTSPNTADSGIFKGMANGNGDKVSIFNRNGIKKAEFQGYTQAAWMPNGGLVVAGDQTSKKGLFIIDANFRTIKKLAEGFETAKFPAVSPDGNNVAFSKNGEIWTIGIDGTNPKVAILGSVASFPVWSPGGNYIAAVVNTVPPGSVVNGNYLFVAKFNTTEGFYLTDQNNKVIGGGNRISWLSDKLPSAKNIPETAQPKKPQTTVNSGTSYNPTQTNANPNFAKAKEIYLQVMGDDLENYNDVAAAITYIVVLNYTYKNKLDGVPTNQVRQVYRQFVEKFSQDEGLKNADNNSKQQLAELAILDGLETAIAVKSNDQKKINETALKLLRKYVGKSADNLKITDNGMEF